MVALKKKSKQNLANRTVVIEITRSDLTLICMERSGDDGQPRIHWRRVGWRMTSASLFSDAGRTEINAGFKKLVEQEGLNGAHIQLARSSDFCVTRVISGENEKVDFESRSLAERSAHYLSLGPGEKFLSDGSRNIDAKRKTAWLTVTSRRTLDIVLEAAEEAGLQIDRIEHSIVSLCRSVGTTGADAESPVLIVDVSQRGIDLGISHQGRLLLDYRPGGVAAKEQVANTVLRHIKRLQRYCNRNFQFADGKISRVFVCGDPGEVPRVFEAFRAHDAFKVEILSPELMADRCELLVGADLPPHLTSAVGLLLATQAPTAELTSPNLIAPLLESRRGPLVPELIKHGWPIGAMILVCIAMWFVNMSGDWTNEALEAESKQLQKDTMKTQAVQLKVSEANIKLRQTDTLKKKLFNPSFRDLLGLVAGCMSEGMWLVEIRVDRDGSMIIAGKSREEGDIFEFVKTIKKAPNMGEVNLEGTRPERIGEMVVTYFEIKCKYVISNDSAEGSSDNG